MNHIATGTSPQPRGKLLTHGHGDEELDGEVDEEVVATARRRRHWPMETAAVSRRGHGRPWGWGWY